MVNVEYNKSEHKVLYYDEFSKSLHPYIEGIGCNNKSQIVCGHYKNKSDFHSKLFSLIKENDGKTIYVVENTSYPNCFGIKIL